MSMIKIPRVESEQRIFEVFLIYLRFCGFALLGMCFQRLSILLSVDGSLIKYSMLKIFEAFYMGARFDLLVLGFIGTPLILIVSFLGLSGYWPLKHEMWILRYFKIFWIFIGLIGFLNFNFFLLYQRHMQWSEHIQFIYFDVLVQVMQKISWDKIVLNYIVWLVSWISIFTFIQDLKIIPSVAKSVIMRRIRVLVAILCVAFFARGNLEAHHLALEHSEISHYPVLNEIVLNPIWTIDKAYTRSSF